MWALGSSPAPPEARGRSPGELWDLPRGHFGSDLDPLGRLWDHLWGNFLESFMPWQCSERRNVLTFAKIYCGNVQSRSATSECTQKKAFFRKKNNGTEFKPTPLIS